ncbi:MAG: hypothetical protein WB660_14280 [Candidatus Sulfotelmatobacter sp.]
MVSTKTAKQKTPVAQLTMKAAAIDRFGPPQVLKLHKLPIPEPGPEEVLIAIQAAGVGVWDASVRDGSWRPYGRPMFAARQWYDDAKAHKPKPTNTVPGITYMLAGATQRSDLDPHDTTSMPIEIGPHWMIMWQFDPRTTGLPTTHKPTGAYIMWAGSPYAHLHIMGSP